MQAPDEQRKILPEKEKRGLLERLLGSQPDAGQTGGDFKSQLRRRAAELEQQGAYEHAAAFYSYLGDEPRAAACYQRLSRDSR